MPTHWKIRKKWNSHREISEKHQKEANGGMSQRRQTIGTAEALNNRIRKSTSMLNPSSIDGPEPVYPIGRRQFMRRPGILVNGHNDLMNSDQSNYTTTSTNFITIVLQDGNSSFKKTVPIKDNRTVEELLATVLHKQGIPEESISDYHITFCREGVYSSVNLDDLAMEYMASVIELKPLRNFVERTSRTSSSPTDHLSVKSCLEYFEANGLVEIPSSVPKDEEDCFHLPRVDPLDPIESSWEELDIDPQWKQSLDNKSASQQQAIWELIATEHSFLRQLEVVINLFMQTLELIRRSGLLTEVNYQNVFGYMEDIYLAHVQFWYMALLPCLEKVRQEHSLLDLGIIILRFPTEIASDFDVYEQHCAFEQTNLKSLNEAMSQKDFKTYLEWCESQPQCERLKLKDFLAKPMQRLTKYSLLLKAILNKTTDESHIDDLEHMIDETSTFVKSVNGVLRAQEETQRVEEVMKNIIGYNPIELTGDYKELVQPYLQLDLLAPMPDVDMTRPRILIVEGKLRYRDNHIRNMVVHVFLFSDMLLVTKMKGVDKYIIIKPPFKISQLQVIHKDSGTLTFIIFNDYNVLTDLFTLKAHSTEVAQEWADHIGSAQEFYNAAMARKTQSWRLLESLQQKRILHGISLDVITPADSTINGTHWSTQSISGSPVPSHNGEGFRRVPSCESTSSSVFPIDSIPTPRQERRLSSLRAASFDQAEHRLSLNLQNSRSTPPLENHRISFPFCTSNIKSSPVLSQRPIWQRAQSLTTVCSTDILAKKKELFQITLMDATTQTDDSDIDHTPQLSLNEDTTDELTTDEEYSPIVNSPTTPISIVVSPSSNGSLRRTHHRTQSLPKRLTMDESFDYQDSYHLSPTSPISPVALHKDLVLKTTADDDSTNDAVPVRHSSLDSYLQRINTADNNSTTPIDPSSSTLPTSFRFDNTVNHSPSSLNNFRSESKFKLPLTKIHERDDEDIDDTPQELSYKMHFTRGGNLRRSKSNFELSYKPRGLLKPPSPLTTHMHQSNEKLNSILSYSHERRYSPVFSPKVVFLGEEDDESDESADNKKMEDPRKRWLEEIKKPGHVKDSAKPPQTEEKKKSFWANKRIKSAGPSKNHKKGGGGFFGLFRGRAMSMESLVDHDKSKQTTAGTAATMSHHSNNNSSKPSSKPSPTNVKHSNKDSTNNLITKSPKLSPKLPRVSPMVSPKLRPHNISSSFSETCNNSQSPSPSKNTLRRQHPMCSSPIEIMTDDKMVFNDNTGTTAAKTVRNSLQLTPPTHRVIFLSANKPLQRPVSAPTSPDVSIRHRSMKVFASDQQQEPLHVL